MLLTCTTNPYSSESGEVAKIVRRDRNLSGEDGEGTYLFIVRGAKPTSLTAAENNSLPHLLGYISLNNFSSMTPADTNTAMSPSSPDLKVSFVSFIRTKQRLGVGVSPHPEPDHPERTLSIE